MVDWTRDYFERGYAQRWGLQSPSDQVRQEAAGLWNLLRVATTGGRLALKVVNGGLVLDDFREAACEEREGVVVSISNTLTLDPPRLTQRIKVSGTRGQGQYDALSGRS